MILSRFVKKVGLGWGVCFFILIVLLSYDLRNAYWNDKQKIISYDVLSYYAYLPATYIYNDISLGFIDKDPTFFRDKFWPVKTPGGRYIIKTTMGLAFLYAPFFFAAHPAAQILGYDANGFSPPYKFALTFGCLFYLGAGLYFLKKLLETYFPSIVVALTLISVTIGTNLLQYATAEATMSHSYNFVLFSIFLYIGMKWHERCNLKNSILLGLLSGLIVLIRPTNILILIVFVLWGVHDARTLKIRILFFIKEMHLVAVMAAAFIAVWIPQMLYWKFTSGSFWYYSYGIERFFFLKPHIIKGLFGFRKGWLVYTPMMGLALIGLGIMYVRLKELFFSILLFTLLNIYVVLSWWSWWYGGGFGLRAFIDSYSLLSIPLAVFINWALDRKTVIQMACISLVFLFLALNVFQTRQYQLAIMHWDSMSAKAYWSIFLKMKQPDNFSQLIEPPDNGKAVIGEED